MKEEKKTSRFSLYLFLISTLLLTLNISTNIFNTVPQIDFDKGLTRQGDGQFVGKLAYDEEHSLWNKNSFFISQIKPAVPFTRANTASEEEYLSHRQNPFRYSYEAYIDKAPIERVNTYKSKMHFTSFLASAFNLTFKPNPKSYIKLLRFLNALILSIILSLIIIWIYKVSNIYGSIIALFTLVFSPLILLMSRSFYFVFYTWYFPFLGASLILYFEQKGKLTLSSKHYLLLGLLMFYHILSHSFEFIPSVGIMSVMPFIFYGIWSQDYKKWFKRLSIVTMVYFFAIGLGSLILVNLIGKYEGGGIVTGIEYIKERYELRSGLEEIGMTDKHQDAIDASYKEVLDIHLDKELTSLYTNTHKAFITIRHFIYFSFVVSIIGLLFSYYKKIMFKKTIAIFISSWFSITAPLSWFIMFKPHSYLHHHFTPIVWYTPFILLCTLMLGHTIQVIQMSLTKKKELDRAIETA